MISASMTVAREFLLSPLKTGAVAPASSKLAQVMITNANVQPDDLVVELGPGTGAVTEVIMKHLSSENRFFALELNPTFAQQTRFRCPGAIVHNDNALNLATHLADLGTEHCDVILSSLPWTLFNRELQQQLLDVIATSLVPGGRFVTYTYLGVDLNPAGRRFRQLIKAGFATTSRSHLVWNNLPPAHVYTCTV